MYTLQQDSHGNTIVCKGGEPRTGYWVIFTGAYHECQARRYMAVKP